MTPLKANISEDMMWNENEEDDEVTLAIIRGLESDCDDDSEARFHLSQGRCIYYDYPGTEELVREYPDGRIEPVDVDDAGCIFVKSLGPSRP
ncbi:hypothetical protein MB84_20705 [Pandoraea oxalativorans]|uniref:Uncharacterized protein n=1 Tax=Pandoraea oxalativorans TaxID=573737 RepID=A0A0E3YF75_9BURK|nr:hypothetical protein MB84_20705 [Pandoraea oxalativorans]